MQRVWGDRRLVLTIMDAHDIVSALGSYMMDTPTMAVGTHDSTEDGDGRVVRYDIAVSEILMNHIVDDSRLQSAIDRHCTNLPPPMPGTHSAMVVAAIACRDYDFSHGNIVWHGSTMLDFAWLWTIVCTIGRAYPSSPLSTGMRSNVRRITAYHGTWRA